MATGSSKKDHDRKHEQLVRSHDEIVDGQSEIKDNQGEIAKGLSQLTNVVEQQGKEEKQDQDRNHRQVVQGINELIRGQSEMKLNQEEFAKGQHELKIAVEQQGKKEKQPSEESPGQRASNILTDKYDCKNTDENVYTGIQETDQSSQQTARPTKLSAGNLIKDIWAKPGFRYGFLTAMDRKYPRQKNIKHWSYLAEQFDCSSDVIESFPCQGLVSPSYTMFQHLERKKPCLKIKNLCEVLKEVNANEVLRIVQQAMEHNAETLTPDVLISEMWDKAPDELDKILPNLDKIGIWKDVARKFGFNKKELESFERDPALNPTGDLFDILQTQRPKHKVEVFKEQLTKIGQEQVLKVLQDNRISDDILISELSNKASVMSEIEFILNNPQDQSLWKLAESFKKDDSHLDFDIEIFRHRRIDESPTFNLMEHVIARSPEELTIKDLVLKLEKINRSDCLVIIAEHLEGGEAEIEEICRRRDSLKLASMSECIEQENLTKKISEEEENY